MSQFQRKDNFIGTAWLVEFGTGPAPAIYYCGPGDWCGNPNHAKKFATYSEAADVQARCVNSVEVRVVEHEWVEFVPDRAANPTEGGRDV